VKKGIIMRHPTRAEAKGIQDGNEFVVDMESTVLPLYQRFRGYDFETKEGAMEHYWHLVREKMGELCSLKNMYTPRKAPTPGADRNEVDRE
jgi:hypothetical protein